MDSEFVRFVSGAALNLLVADGTLLALTYILERGWGFCYEGSSRIIYDRIALITPEHRELLLADLRQRTGLPVKRVEIGRLDLLRTRPRSRSTMITRPRWRRSCARKRLELDAMARHSRGARHLHVPGTL